MSRTAVNSMLNRKLTVGFWALALMMAGCSDETTLPAGTSPTATPLAPAAPLAGAEAIGPEADSSDSSSVETAAADRTSTGESGNSRNKSIDATESQVTPDAPPSAQTTRPADEESDTAAADKEIKSEDVAKRPQGTKLPEDLLEGSQLTPLNPQKTVFLDLPGKRILLKAKVCLTQGLLEMLLCPHQTKEHESILSTEAQAFTVHTGLLALGCKEGTAARYDPDTEKYFPASGQVIDIFLHWKDVDGKLHREPAQSWVRGSRQRYYQAKFETLPADLKLEPDGNLRYDEVNQYLFWYGPMTEQERDQCLKMSDDKKFQEAIRQFHKDGQEKPMKAEWVFVGSGFYEDGDSAKQYLAEGGYMICVANFAMAMIDVSTASDSNGTESLSYEAATEQIPPRESEVLIELIPRPVKKATDDKAAVTPDKVKPETTKPETSSDK